MLPQLRVECLGRYVCLGTLAVWLHSLSYGTWLDINLFYSLAIVLGMREDPVFPAAREAARADSARAGAETAEVTA
jgi:hypothetical protein